MMESIKNIMIFLMIATVALQFMFAAAMKENDDRYYKRNSKLTDDDLKLLDGISEIKEEDRKILISVNKGGPNNQIWGLREGLFLSSLLGRQFVASLFFRHYTTKGHFYMKPDVFLNMENLSRRELYFKVNVFYKTNKMNSGTNFNSQIFF